MARQIVNQLELPWLELLPDEPSGLCTRCGGRLTDPMSIRYSLGLSCHRAALGYDQPKRNRRTKAKATHVDQPTVHLVREAS